MSNDFKIVITAIDKATANFKKINSSVDQLSKSLDKSKKLRDSIGKNPIFEKEEKAAAKAAKAAEDADAAIAKFGWKSAGVIASGAAAVGALTVEWAKLGWEISRAATSIGISTNDLQSLQGAAKLAGVSAESMTGSLKSLGDVMNDAVNGRNQQALVLMNRLGISLHRTKDGAVDTARAMKDFADVLSRPELNGNAQTRGLIERMFGIESLDPLLIKGSVGIEADRRKAEKSGAVGSPEQIARAKKGGESLEQIGLKAKGVGIDVSDWFLKNYQPVIDKFLDPNASATETAATLAMSIFNGSSLGKPLFGPTNNQPAVGANGLNTRGIRQNNPGNLRSWGNYPVSNGFVVFPDAQTGVNAARDNLLAKFNKHGLNTMRGIIGDKDWGWAPATDGNDVSSYLSDVAKRSGLGIDEKLDKNNPEVISKLLDGIFRHENNGLNPFSKEIAALNAPQKVDVNVNFQNVPQGTRVNVNATPGVSASARIGYNNLTGGGP